MSYKNIYYKKKSGRTGAAAENMALIALEMGIGSLWNGNIFFAYDELKNWLDAGEMVLAISFGAIRRIIPLRCTGKKRKMS